MDDFNPISKLRGKASSKSKGAQNPFLEGVLAFVSRIRGLLVLVGVALMIWLFYLLFTTAYYEKNPNFMVAPEDIIVRGNSTITQAYILQCFNITGKRNAHELVRSEIVSHLSQKMPILKDAKMTYTAGGQLEIWVEERMPLARIAGDIRPPLVVDDEGVIFSYSRSTNSYPEIAGFDLPEDELQPGQKLPESLHCMLRLLQVTADTEKFFPSAVKRVSLLGVSPDDGLKVTLLDGRKIDIAWDHMAMEKEVSEDMCVRLRNVARALRSSVAEGKTHFNAMAIDRVTASE